MSGTFSSLSSALSGLRYNRVAMDVASGNVANAGTEGYARRQVIGQATGAPAAPAMWSRWATAGGDGVEPGAITRMVDPLLDSRARTEHAGLSYHDTRSTSLVRFETTLGEPGENGVSAALSAFRPGGTTSPTTPATGRAQPAAGACRDAGRGDPRPRTARSPPSGATSGPGSTRRPPRSTRSPDSSPS